MTLKITCRALLVAIAVLLPICANAQAALQQKPRDSIVNGTLIGAGVGFAVGFLGLAAFNARETASGPIWDGEDIGIYTGVGLLCAGIGAGIGAAIDSVRKDARTRVPNSGLRVSPVWGRRAWGGRVAIRF